MGVQILHLDFEGTVISQTLPTTWQNNGKLRLAQCRAYENPSKRLAIAKAFVEAKTGKRIPKSCNTLLKLLNFEAVQSQFYWDKMNNYFKANVPKLAKDFRGRRIKGQDNKGAHDPINSMLNWDFTILGAVARKYIMSTGLLQEVGFLHSVTGRDWKQNRDSLTYDIIEPFRDVSVRSMLKILHTVKSNDFRQDRGDYRPVMSMDLRKKLTMSLAEALNMEVEYQNKTWHVETVMQDYVKILAQSLIEGQTPHFPCFSLIVLDSVVS